MIIDEKILYKFLRYLIQTIIIYLILRYTPYVNLEMNKAIMIAILLTILCIVLEFLYVKMFNQETITENFIPNQLNNSKPIDQCNSCTIEKFTQSVSHAENIPPQNNQPVGQKCRVVCDGDKLENFDSNINNPKTETKTLTVIEHHAKPVQEIATREIIEEEIKNTPLYNYDNGFGGMFYDETPFYQNTGDEYLNKRRQQREEAQILNNQKALEENAITTAGYNSPYQEVGAKSERRKDIETGRQIAGDIDNELVYGDYNSLPVASGYKSHDYEYGYNFLPPERWFNSPPRTPICVTNSPNTVSPMYANGTPADVKEWHSLRVTPPDMINTTYINEKLNTGK